MPATYKYKMTVVKNDFGYNIPLRAEDEGGTPVNLTGATTIKLKVAEPDADTCKFVGNCVIDNATTGLCHYVVANGNFNEVETYNAELEITWGSPATKTVTCRGVTIKVVKELPAT